MATSANATNIVNRGITRTVCRWMHIVFAIPILGYIYSPFERLPGYAFELDLSSFLLWSFRDCGCGKAMWCDD